MGAGWAETLPAPKPPVREQRPPVWMAALMAAHCCARCGTLSREIRWRSEEGRAVYTNAGRSTENIEPLGIKLPPGGKLAVWWIPGSTEYTIEVSDGAERCA